MGPLPVTRPFKQKKSQIDSMVLQVVLITHLYETIRRGFTLSVPNQHNNCYPKQLKKQNPPILLGLVETKIDGVIKKSIGCLISPNIVMTCATSIFSLQKQVAGTDISFSLSLQTGQQQKFKVKNHYLHEKLKQQRQMDHNIALLHLQTQEDLELMYGSFGYNFEQKTPDDINNGSYFILKPNIDEKYKIMSTQFVKINLSQTENQFQYQTNQILTHDSPIIEEIQGQYQIVGFHYQDKSTNTMSFGVKFTPDMFKDIKQKFIETKEGFSLWLGNFGNEGVIYATTRPNFNPSIINLGRNIIDDEAIPAIAESHWSKAVEISIMINSIANECETDLSQGKYTHLRNLNLRSNKITDKGLQNLCRGNWKSLTHLFLQQNLITSAGIEHLSHTNWINLTNLNLNRNMIGPIGVEHLVKTDFKLIKLLDLSLTNIEDEGCYWLTQSKWKYLQTLILGLNPITKIGAQFISNCNWNRLSVLKMESCQLDLDCIEALRHGKWPQLTQLNLSSNLIGSKGCRALIKANWPLLNNLNISVNDIDDIGLATLTKGNFPQLQSLHLYQNHFSTRLVSNLIHGNWKKLKNLSFQPNLGSVQVFKPALISDWRHLADKTLFIIKDNMDFNQLVEAKFQST